MTHTTANMIIDLCRAENIAAAMEALRSLAAIWDDLDDDQIKTACKIASNDWDSDRDILDALQRPASYCDAPEVSIDLLTRINDEDHVLDLYGDSGANGVWFPANDTEECYANYWSSGDEYTWCDMVNDIDLDEATAIMTSEQDDRWEVAKENGTEEETAEAIRAELYDADDAVRQLACDAVEFEEFDHLTCAILRIIN